jgi:hypothetical protein
MSQQHGPLLEKVCQITLIMSFGELVLVSISTLDRVHVVRAKSVLVMLDGALLK